MSHIPPTFHLDSFYGKFSLKTILILPFVLLIFTAVGLTGYFSLLNGAQAVNDVAKQLRQEVTNRIVQHLENYVALPHHLNKINNDVIKQNLLNTNEQLTLQKYFWNQIQHFSTVGFIYYANEIGEVVGVERLSDGTLQADVVNREKPNQFHLYKLDESGERNILKKIVPDFDPRQRPWYQTAILAGKPAWSQVFSYRGSPRLAISAVYPLFNSAQQRIGIVASDLLLAELSQFLKSLKIGENGKVFIMERSGLLVAASHSQPFIVKEGKTERLSALKQMDILQKEAAAFIQTHFNGFEKIHHSQQLEFYSNGHRQFLQIEPFKEQHGLDWLIVTVVPESDFMEHININTRLTLILSLLALALTLGAGILTAQHIVHPILKLNHFAKQLSVGNWYLSKKLEISIHHKNELGELANSFNRMAEQLYDSFVHLEEKVQQRTIALERANHEISLLNQRLEKENLRMCAELDIARRLQHMVLPHTQELHQIKDLEIIGFMETASEVGGDYYDVLQYHNQIIVSIGDVTGHGLESGVLMLMVQTAVRTLIENNMMKDLAFFTVLNRALYQNLKRMGTDKNLTLTLLNYEAGRVIVTGQHEEVLIVRASGEIERIDTFNLGHIIGLCPDIQQFINHHLFELAIDEGIILYTDGIIEAINPDKQLYGIDKMCAVIQAHWAAGAQAVQQAIINDVKRHTAYQQLLDDMTLVVLKRRY